MAARLLLTVGVVALAACSGPTGDLSGFACDGERCLDGFACHPELFICVPRVEVGCNGTGLCPSTVATGDACDEERSFLPCVDGTLGCGGGCRTCLDGRWSECTEPTCILGEPFSCASCDDNCALSVRNATPVCDVQGAAPQCNYAGNCRDGTRDADGDRSNGCECIPGSEEVCDGVDNDCDGETDEGFATGEPCGVGVCAGGVTECNAGGTGVLCSTGPGGSADSSDIERCDGLDNDCNGDADEVFECRGGEVTLCDPGNGDIGAIVCDSLTCVLNPCVAAFGERRAIVFDRAGTSRALNDFPVLVRLDDTNVNRDRLSVDGADLRFLDDASFLSHEIESWDPTGLSEVWVAVPTLASNSVSDRIDLLYDGLLAGLPSVAPKPTWSAFAAVYHFDGSAGVYRDATGNGYEVPDALAGEDGPGLVGRGISPGTGEFLSLPAGLIGDGPFAVSFWVSPKASRPAYRRPVTLSRPSPEVNTIVPVHLTPGNFNFDHALSDGRDLEVLGNDGSPLEYWVERWGSDEALLWVELPTVDVTSFQLVYGRNVTATRSDLASVMRPGMWVTGWDTDGTVSGDAGSMAAFFDGLSYDGAAASAGGIALACVDNCNPQDTPDDYATLFEGWLQSPAPGTYTIGIDVEEAGEIWVGGTDFKALTGATLAAAAYGTRDGNPDADDSGDVELPAVTRFVVRIQQDGGSNSRIFAFRDGAPMMGTEYFHAPRYTPAIVATPGPEELIATDLELGPIELATADGYVIARYGTEELRAPIPAGYRFVAFNYEPSTTTLTLFVDGVREGTLSVPGSNVSPLATLRVGHIRGNDFSPASAIDELRVSRTVRSEEWLQATRAAVVGTLIRYP